MIKLQYSSEKTNSFRPTPWHWSIDPFPAFRGNGARYNAFQAVGHGYIPRLQENMTNGYHCPQVVCDEQFTKIIKTQKGTNLIVTCPEQEDELILLLTLRGGFRGHYSRIEPVNAEILFKRGGNIHCCPTEHIVARLTHKTGYIFAETGRRCGSGLIEIFSWNGYQTMPTEEFEIWQDSQS